MMRTAPADAPLHRFDAAAQRPTSQSARDEMQLRVARFAAVSQSIRKPPALVAVEYGVAVMCLAVAAYISLGH